MRLVVEKKDTLKTKCPKTFLKNNDKKNTQNTSHEKSPPNQPTSLYMLKCTLQSDDFHEI